ncbi:hypothetical protein SRHO_G00127840 [Serrasalmus rhombeus]
MSERSSGAALHEKWADIHYTATADSYHSQWFPLKIKVVKTTTTLTWCPGSVPDVHLIAWLFDKAAPQSLNPSMGSPLDSVEAGRGHAALGARGTGEMLK